MTSMIEAPPELLDERLAAVRAGVGAALRETFARHERDTAGPDWAAGIGLLRTLTLGAGKMIRPAMCVLGFSAYGGAGSPGLWRAAAALELFHAFALVHDDVMDDSHTRRGRPAVHVSLAARHRGHGWRGDPVRFGRNVAVLWGDLCLVWSDELFHSCGLDVRRALGLLHQMRSEVLVGQYLDLRGDAFPADLPGCFEILRAKSARYTVERPLQIGAALAGASDAALEALSRYGLPLGEAFQLRDDVLGVFGDEAVTGKSALTDLRDGKSTVLMALTRRRVSPAQDAVLRRWFGNPELTPDGAAAIRQIVVDTGSLSRVNALVEERSAAAISALDALDIAAGERLALTEMASRLTDRSR